MSKLADNLDNKNNHRNTYKEDHINTYKEDLESFLESIYRLWHEIYISDLGENIHLQILLDNLKDVDTNIIKPYKASEDIRKLLNSLSNFPKAQSSHQDFLLLLDKVKDLIHWYPNSIYENPSVAVTMQNYCANIVGKKRSYQNSPSLFYNEKIIVGLFLLGANKVYPKHKHPAAEMWLILKGRSKWKKGDGTWTIKGPGDYFICLPNENHEVETSDDILLALWAWTGNLESWGKWSD